MVSTEAGCAKMPPAIAIAALIASAFLSVIVGVPVTKRK